MTRRHLITPKGDVVIVLSAAETRALHMASEEGFGATGDSLAALELARKRFGGQSSLDAAARAVDVLAQARAELPGFRKVGD